MGLASIFWSTVSLGNNFCLNQGRIQDFLRETRQRQRGASAFHLVNSHEKLIENEKALRRGIHPLRTTNLQLSMD